MVGFLKSAPNGVEHCKPGLGTIKKGEEKQHG